MNALFEYLATLADQPLGTVVHIGAGNGRDLESYDSLRPNRLVLVEGDPDAATELQRHVAHWPWAEVHARPVAAQAGPLAWNRYTLPGLNGPLQTGALSAFYPRLRLFESRTLDALALPELLAGLSIECDEARVNVLVLDVPGQEGSLLASLPQEQIVKFGFVLLRGVREALLPWGCTAAQAVDQLRASCFDIVIGSVEQEPLWPVTLLRFDAQRYQAEQLEQRLHAMQAALETADKTAAERAAQIQQLTQARDEQAKLAAERQAQLESLTQAKAAAEKTAAERAAQVQQLTQARDEQAKLAGEQTKLAADRQAQLESLTQAKAAADKTAAERAAQIEQLNQAKAAVDKTAAERAAQIQQLTQARDEQAKLAGEQTRLAAERATLMAERQTKIEALTKEKAQAITERDALAKEKTTLVAARDEQTKLAREANQRKTVLDAELAEISARYGLLQEELIKAEAQIELIADLLLRDPRA